MRTWRITDEVDERGYFVLDKHVTVTIVLEGVTRVELSHFNLPSIIHGLRVTGIDRNFQVSWTASYGVEGILRAEQLRVELTPDGR